MTLSPAAQATENFDFLNEWFEYNIESPSCIAWKKQPRHGRSKAGQHCKYFSKYYRVKLMGVWYSCHRIVLILNGLEPMPGQIADHINRDRKDNRIENLRWLTESQNRQNSTIRGISGWKHAQATKYNTFRANYRYPNASKTVYCGTYKTAQEAHYAAISHKLENYWRP